MIVKKSKCITEVYSRITGYFRPVNQWNPGKGKDGEFADRKHYNLTKQGVTKKEE